MPEERLTGPEQVELDRLCGVVKRGAAVFVEVGVALLRIRDARLWRGKAESFNGFCQAEFGFTHRRAGQLIEAAGAVLEIASGGVKNAGLGSMLPNATKTPDHPPTPNTRQAEEIAKAPAGKRGAVWEKVVATAPPAPNGQPKVTAAHVRRVVQEEKSPPPPPGKSPAAELDAPKDGTGRPIPEWLRAAFAGKSTLLELAGEAFGIARQMKEFCLVQKGGAFIDLQDVKARCDGLAFIIKRDMPYAVCRLCGGRKGGCDACDKQGWLPKERYEATTPKELKDPPPPPGGKGRAA